MGAAMGTQNLGSTPVRIGYPVHGSRDFIIKTWPSATRVELVVGPVQGRIASFASIRALQAMLFKLARERPFGPLMDNNALFFFRKLSK